MKPRIRFVGGIVNHVFATLLTNMLQPEVHFMY